MINSPLLLHILAQHLQNIDAIGHVVDYYPILTKRDDILPFIYKNRLHITTCTMQASRRILMPINHDEGQQYDIRIDMIYGYDGLANDYKNFTQLCHNLTHYIGPIITFNGQQFSTMNESLYGITCHHTTFSHIIQHYPALKAECRLRLTEEG